MLSGLPSSTHPGLVVGTHTLDDAAVLQWPGGSAHNLMVQTIDVITPLVDDPFVFGQIAAANALSDVYAMGGTPIVALAYAAFPTDVLSLDTIREILAGGLERVTAAGAIIAGGHTLKDADVKYGLAVTGQVERSALVTNAGGQEGDLLVLTKPLGTGLLHGALRAETLSSAHYTALIKSMITLNADAAQAMRRVKVHAATDVTGFGLLGHAMQLAKASQLAVKFFGGALPILPGARALATAKIGGAAGRNHAYAAPYLPASQILRVLADPQTSGGMLAAVPAHRVHALQAAFRDAGCLVATVVGELVAGEPGTVQLSD